MQCHESDDKPSMCYWEKFGMGHGAIEVKKKLELVSANISSKFNGHIQVVFVAKLNQETSSFGGEFKINDSLKKKNYENRCHETIISIWFLNNIKLDL